MHNIPEDIELEICEAFYSLNARRGKIGRVSINQVQQHNASNHTFGGEIEIDGKFYGFVIDNGDSCGTVVREWDNCDGYFDEVEPTYYTFIPANPELKETSPIIYGVYLQWRKTEWFQEKERGLNYDRHFAPGIKTEEYYRDWAAAKGMIVSCE